jgi:hypothetical protein
METRDTFRDGDPYHLPWPNWIGPLSPRRIATSLPCQQSTLEEYIFTGRPNDLGMDETIYGSLKGLTAMKRLAVPRKHLVLWEAEFRSLPESSKRVYLATECNPTSLSQQLPPKLEQLCLYLEEDFEWLPLNLRENWWQRRQYDYCYRAPATATGYAPELRDWLLEIASHKFDKYPALKFVKLQKPSKDYDSRISFHLQSLSIEMSQNAFLRDACPITFATIASKMPFMSAMRTPLWA